MPQTVEYAFRALACLSHDPDAAHTVDEMADRIGVPKPYLSRVMRRLVIAKLVSSRRGLHGGYRLTRPPAQIRYTDILVAMEFDAGSGHCAFGLPQCDASKPCPLHDSWLHLQASFRQWAASHSLADIEASAAASDAGGACRPEGAA